MSPKLVHVSQNSSVISLPISPRIASPLRQTITVDGISRSQAPALVARPGKSRLRAWEVETTVPRPSTANSDIGVANTRAPSPTSPVSSRHQRDASDDGPPQLDLGMSDFRASFRSIFPIQDWNADSSGDTESRRSISYSRPLSQKRRSRSVGDFSVPQSPLPVYNGEKSFFAGTTHDRSASKDTNRTESKVNLELADLGNSFLHSRPLHLSNPPPPQNPLNPPNQSTPGPPSETGVPKSSKKLTKPSKSPAPSPPPRTKNPSIVIAPPHPPAPSTASTTTSTSYPVEQDPRIRRILTPRPNRLS